MASGPENRFRASVNRHLPTTIYHCKMHNPYNAGIPDDWYSGNASDLWVEYKFLTRTPQRAVVWAANPKGALLSMLQTNWINARYDEGRKVAVVIGCPDGGAILRDQEWNRQIDADDFRKMLVSRLAIAQWITDVTTR